MSSMEKISSIVYRIRWRSVFAVILLIAAVALLTQYLPSGYAVGSGVGLRVTAEPKSISPGGSSNLEIELKNLKTDRDLSVIVKGQTYDKKIFFDESYSQEYGSASINVGPQETRKIMLKVKTKKEILDGKYTIDLKAIPDGIDKGAETRVFLTVASD